MSTWSQHATCLKETVFFGLEFFEILEYSGSKFTIRIGNTIQQKISSKYKLVKPKYWKILWSTKLSNHKRSGRIARETDEYGRWSVGWTVGADWITSDFSKLFFVNEHDPESLKNNGVIWSILINKSHGLPTVDLPPRKFLLL